MVADGTEYNATEKRGDALAQRLSEVYRAIEDGHGKDRVAPGPAREGGDQEPPEEQFDGDEIGAVRKLVQQLVPAAVWLQQVLNALIPRVHG